MELPIGSKKVQLESYHQKALIRWASYNPILRKYLYHIPNGSQRNKIVGANLKMEGVKRGISDLHLPYPVGIYHGLWIELKAPIRSRKPTPEQIEWLSSMMDLNFASTIAYGWEEGKIILEAYLKNDMDVLVEFSNFKSVRL